MVWSKSSRARNIIRYAPKNPFYKDVVVNYRRDVFDIYSSNTVTNMQTSDDLRFNCNIPWDPMRADATPAAYTNEASRGFYFWAQKYNLYQVLGATCRVKIYQLDTTAIGADSSLIRDTQPMVFQLFVSSEAGAENGWGDWEINQFRKTVQTAIFPYSSTLPASRGLKAYYDWKIMHGDWDQPQVQVCNAGTSTANIDADDLDHFCIMYGFMAKRSLVAHASVHYNMTISIDYRCRFFEPRITMDPDYPAVVSYPQPTQALDAEGEEDMEEEVEEKSAPLKAYNAVSEEGGEGVGPPTANYRSGVVDSVPLAQASLPSNGGTGPGRMECVEAASGNCGIGQGSSCGSGRARGHSECKSCPADLSSR